MARISQYPIDTNISNNDQLLGTDAESASVTKKFTVGDLSAYINGQSPGSPGSGTVTSVSGTGTVSGLTLSGTVTSSGELTLGGSLEIDPADITSAIGYTPYNASNPNGFTSFAEPAIFSGGGTPTLASGVTAEEIRTLIGAGSGEGSGTVTSIDATAGTGISVSGVPITTSGTITITNTAPDTGVPAILSNGSVPTLNTGITAEEIRTLIGAGDGTGSIESVSGTAPIISSGGATPVISISAATTSAAGSMSAADKTKLDGIASGAQVNVGTDLSKTASTTDVAINSSTGANVSIGAASTSSAGVMTKALYDNVIANNAKVSNVTTNLGYTASTTNGVVTSSDGTNATLPLVVSNGNAGLMTGADKTKLDNLDAVTTNFVKNTNDTFSNSPKVNQIVTLTQAEYDNTNKYAEYLYIIVD
jgi:hypothetical protein